MSDQHNDGLLVIGAGLMRTGTNSLQVALQRLLNGKCYHMLTVMENIDHADFWQRAADKEPTDEEWRAFFADFNAAVDLPPVCFYKQLIRVYPHAKVVLSVRDPEKWYQSVCTTIAPTLTSVERFPFSLVVKLTNFGKFLSMIRAVTSIVLGPNYDYTDKERMLAAFHRHVEEVKRVIPEDRLLIFEAKDGWGPLCNFLGKEVPSEPYPRVNTSDEFLARVRRKKIVNTGTVLVWTLVIAGLGYFSYRYAEAHQWTPSTLFQFGVAKEL